MTAEQIENYLRQELPEELYGHVMRTRATAVEIAGKCGVPAGPCSLAALLHDCCRHLRDQELLKLAEEFCIVVSDVEKDKPLLLHGPVGAEIARRDFGVNDGEVLDTVRYHTTGRAGMSLVEQVVYLADKVEPGKPARPPRVNSASDLPGALLEQASRVIMRCINEGLPIHPGSVEMRNWLLRRGLSLEHGAL